MVCPATRRRVLLTILVLVFTARWAAGAGTGDKALSKEECQEFAAAVEEAVGDQDVEAFSDLIDWERIVEKATSGFQGNLAVGQARATFKKTMRAEATHPAGYCAQIIGVITRGGKYRNLRVHEEVGQPRCRFRLLLPGGVGFNYHDYVLARGNHGRPIAVDVFVTASGELLSDSFRRAFAPLIAEAAKGPNRLAGSNDDQIVHAASMMEMAQAVGQRRYASALEIYKSFPESLKKDKNLLLLRLRAAQSSDPEEYKACLEDYREFHPDDIALDLLLIDYHLLRKEYAEALKSVDRIDESVEGDPQLHVVRANILYLDQQLPAAKEAAEKAIEEEAGLLNAHWVLVTISLRDKKFDETLSLLRRIKTTFPIEFGDFTQVPEYAEFVKSPQYQEWLKTVQAEEEAAPATE